MNKTKIEWVRNPDGSQGYTWNPIKGICPVGCWYCYARRMYQRFNWEKKPYFFYPEVMRPHDIKKPKKIFVCSTFELFHPITNTLLFPLTEGSDITYRDMIFKAIKENPQHTFQILTKFPQNIDRPMPDNVWLGATITGEDSIVDTKRIFALELIKAKLKFISYEPLLDEEVIHRIPFAKWIIVGRLTGFGKKHDPRRGAINFLVESQRRCGSAIFLKDNLKEIWGDNLIQEFPND